MKQNLMLTIASLLSILFMTLHLTSSDELHSRCCITGGGPAGMMLGYLLAPWRVVGKREVNVSSGRVFGPTFEWPVDHELRASAYFYRPICKSIAGASRPPKCLACR
jgi:hypothetical protein